MQKEDDALNILNFWESVERFTPFKVETKEKFGYVKSIQKEVLRQKDIPWLNKAKFNHNVTDTHSWVYTIFLGIVRCSDVTMLTKQMLEVSGPDYDLNQTKELSCICSFQVNIHGRPIPDSFEIPDYFIGMSCLTHRKNNPSSWLSNAPNIRKKITDAFENLCDCKNIFEFTDLSEFLEDALKLADLETLLKEKLITNTAVIYSSQLPIPKPPKDKRGKDSKNSDDTVQIDKLKDIDSVILNSFFIDDLQKLMLALSKKNGVGLGIRQYLGLSNELVKQDVAKDNSLIKKYTSPQLLPPARWPGAGDHSLFLSQQMSVNLALAKKEGIFSVNGPPGTGKSTLLRDIISNIVVNRAKALSELKSVNEAFVSSSEVPIDGYRYKAWKLKPELLGHEIVVASSNNGAVENISKEIPRLDQIDQKWDLDYFSEIAENVTNEKSWGIGAAVLGNKKNRSDFFSNFWDKKPSDKPESKSDLAYGLKYLLEKKKPVSNWNETKKKFLDNLKQYEKLQDELIQLSDIIDNLPKQKQELENIKNNLELTKLKAESLNSEIADTQKELSSLEKLADNKKILLDSYITTKPPWIVVVLDIITKNTSYKDWQNGHFALMNDLQVIFDKIVSTSENISILKKTREVLGSEKADLKQNFTLTQKAIAQNTKLLSEYKEKIGKNLPDNDFWNLPDDKLHKLFPWFSDKLHEIRGQLFIDAIDLHKSFIINASERLMNNLRCMNYIARRNSWPEKSNDCLRSIWASLFLAVPVISTTFASFATLFRGMEKESIGWLLIDEAGQAAPQLAVGAIYRSKRSVIVGDPMQIQPVVTIPKAMNNVLMEYHNISEKWSPLQESTQTIADRVNPYGTYVGFSEHKKWVGCPLRVHRRCAEPMFSIANIIAYDGLMIQATSNKKSKVENIFPESKWIHVAGTKSYGNWIPDEGKVVLNLLSQITNELKSLPSLYIISPFKVAASNMQHLMRDDINSWCNNSINKTTAFKWISKSVGTIHTFQGKQADVVILLLGGNPDKLGALDWAALSPNILNVGLTRAKNIVLAVGNYDLWSMRGCFQELSHAIKKVNFENKQKPNAPIIEDTLFEKI